jgi:hypothetical protein
LAPQFFGVIMKVSVTAKAIFDDKLGRLNKGQTVELPEHKARFYLERGEVEYYETKVLRERPYQAVGAPLSALPAAQVSQTQTLSELDNGEKRRKRKTLKVLLSQTPPLE